ncbi:Schwann cell myelin protein [Melopsittacus undulatus]|uniref:Schwann cell myelin protein n=1 Tax=Melopsittacus undulatus TaxID=13146 RepID=UPI00146D07D9|nr:myelin-associated glycoprotein [Melopsittacus undulatus]
MPPSLSGVPGSCLSIPCRFSFPDELRPTSIRGLWFFGSPYPRSYPPVVARSRGGAVHESFQGRAVLIGDPNLRDCSLLLDPLGSEMGGKYYFRGDLGGYNQYSFSEHVTVEVVAEPLLELPPILVAGLEAELRCRIPDSCPRLRPRLLWDGIQDLPDHSQWESRDEASGAASVLASLRFRPRRQDGGRSLRCHAAFDNSSLALQAEVELDVEFPPQVLSVQGPPQAPAGSPLTLLCEAEGRPSPLLSWFRGAELLREEPGASRLELPLPRLSPAHAGTYTCVAENRHGVDNRSLELEVHYPPLPPQVTGSLRALAGDPLRVTCSARGHPPPALTLTRGRRLVAVGAGPEPEVTLERQGAGPRDGGGYECRAENQYGHSSLGFNITVEFPPQLLGSSHCTVTSSDGARCRCSAWAVPAPTVTFELPSRNVTVTEGHGDFRLVPGGAADDDVTSGAVTTAMLSLRGALEPELSIICRAGNGHGSVRGQLRFRYPGGLVWAKVGPVGAVVAFAIIIALVCYLSQSRRKKAAGSPAVTPGQGAEPEPEQRPLQARWLRWALQGGEGPGAPPDPAPPPKLSRDPPEEPPEYAEIRVK